jgi:hypothetical protein
VLTRKRFIETASVRSILRRSPRSDEEAKVDAMPDAVSLLHFFTALFAHNYALPAHNLPMNAKQPGIPALSH